MTQTTKPGHTTDPDGETGYYAVNAERVLQVFELFDLRPSHFRASGHTGAHGVYYDARKISDGRTGNRWGHHTPAALKSFCHFTQSENGTQVPWQELVEDREAYDGKEGAGPRTGNRLRTETRLRLKPAALSQVRQHCDISRQQLAEKTALPVRFICALEDGSWSTVTEGTAKHLAKALGVTEETLFAPLSEPQQPETGEPVDVRPTTTLRPSFTRRTAGILLLASFFGLIVWMGYTHFAAPHPDVLVAAERETASENDTGSADAGRNNPGDPLAAASGLAPSPKQLPLTTTAELTGCWNWSNDAYIVVNADGTAHNGPFGATWTRDAVANGHYTVTWPSFVDTLTLSSDGSTLNGANNYGIPVSAIRKSGLLQGVEGTWLWFTGITMTVHPDSTIAGGGFKGTWLKAGDKWVFEWPLVDTVSLSADGNNLSVINQFGSTTAKRDTICKGS